MTSTPKRVRLFAWVFESAWARALIPNALLVVIGVLSGALITDITTPQGLNWHIVYRSSSLYALIAVTAVQAWYTRKLFLYERELMRFLDDDYCIAYMRSVCLPELAARAQERIRTGHGGEFKQAMDEIQDVLGLK